MLTSGSSWVDSPIPHKFFIHSQSPRLNTIDKRRETLKGGKRNTESLELSGHTELHDAKFPFFFFITPTYPGQGTAEASNLKLPTDIDKKALRKACFPGQRTGRRVA